MGGWVHHLMAAVSGGDAAAAHKAHATQPRVLGCRKDLLCDQAAPCVALSRLPVSGGRVGIRGLEPEKQRNKAQTPKVPILQGRGCSCWAELGSKARRPLVLQGLGKMRADTFGPILHRPRASGPGVPDSPAPPPPPPRL